MKRYRVYVGAALALMAAGCAAEPAAERMGASSQAVVGGVAGTEPGSLVMVVRDGLSETCAGVVIGPNAVLTSVHCAVSDWAEQEFSACPQWPNADAVATLSVLAGSNLDAHTPLPAVVRADVAPDDDCFNAAVVLTLVDAVDPALASVSPVRQSEPVTLGETLLVAGFGMDAAVYDIYGESGIAHAAETTVDCLDCSVDGPTAEPTPLFGTPPAACAYDLGATAFDDAGAVVGSMIAVDNRLDEECLASFYVDVEPSSAWIKLRVSAAAAEANLDPPEWAGGPAQEPDPPADSEQPATTPPSSDDGGCSFAAGRDSNPAWWLGAPMLGLVLLRRRRNP
jgi:MYXO-CTERM domain-containing protein